MQYQDITVSDIKKKYFREKLFLFSPYKDYDESKEYSLDEQVIYFNLDKVSRELYKSLKNTNTDPLTNNLSWEKQTDLKLNQYITDSDIAEAIAEAILYTKENPLLENRNVDSVFLLVAHYLEYNISSKNKPSQIQKPVSSLSTSAGSASVSYDNNLLNTNWINNAAFYSTVYGSQYVSLYKKYRPLIRIIL